jgi:hypothetical protein
VGLFSSEELFHGIPGLAAVIQRRIQSLTCSSYKFYTEQGGPVPTQHSKEILVTIDY